MSSRVLCWLVALAAVGCTKQASVPPGPEKVADPKPGGGPPALTPAVAPAPAGDATAFAKDFLKAVHEGTATAAQLTPPFKKVIAEPVFEADQALGYSDSAADNWLKQYQGKLTAPSVYAFGATPDAQLFTAFLPGEKPRAVTLRLAKGAGVWLVDWFLPAEVAATLPPTGDAPAFAAAAFLEAMLGRNSQAAGGLMTADAKKRLAPPFAGEKRPFNAGILDQKLAAYRGAFTGFTLAKVENGVATGELTGATKKPFTLKLVAGERPFDWLVDDVKVD